MTIGGSPAGNKGELWFAEFLLPHPKVKKRRVDLELRNKSVMTRAPPSCSFGALVQIREKHPLWAEVVLCQDTWFGESRISTRCLWEDTRPTRVCGRAEKYELDFSTCCPLGQVHLYRAQPVQSCPVAPQLFSYHTQCILLHAGITHTYTGVGTDENTFFTNTVHVWL